MKKIILCISLIVASNSAFAAQNSNLLLVAGVDFRLSGVNSVYVGLVPLYLGGSGDTELPDESCDLRDRGVIDVSGGTNGADKLMEAAKPGQSVTFRVDGCVLVNPGESALTAPKIIKITTK